MHIIARPAQDRSAATSKLTAYLDGARSRSGGALNRIMNEVPHDQLVKASKLEFASEPEGVEYIAPDGNNFALHGNALQQIAQRAHVPMDYIRHLQDQKSDWAHSLLGRTLTDHYAAMDPNMRVLTRTVGTQTRAVLSDSFKRIDARPGLNTLAEIATGTGWIISDAVATDTRVSVRFLSPQLHEITPGEFVLLGMGWSNSDYGRGASDLQEFILRLWCLNGAMAESSLRQIHLGRKMSGEDIRFSDRTQRLMSAAEIAALRDAGRQIMGVERAQDRVGKLTAAASTPVNPEAKLADLRKRVGKALAKEVADAYNRPDVENLPAGQTAWRWSNALSWVAGHTDDAETRLDLEQEAGKALDAVSKPRADA